MRVLVAEDDALVRRFVSRSLEALGHAVETAADGAELLRLASAGKPDLILSDIDMPVCDGITACRHLRRALPGTRFMLMTGDPDSAEAAARDGFWPVLIKPFELDRLKAALAS